MAEALQHVTDSATDVALVDVSLPDGDGLQLSRLLTGAPWRMRVLLVSSNSDAVTAREAAAVGAVAFVPKAELSSALLHSIIEDG